MNSFYLPELSQDDKTIAITDTKEIHHIKNVLRLKKNSLIGLFNGRSIKGEGSILEINDKKIKINITKIYTIKIKLPVMILACAIPKKSKFETIIEKTTELGIDEIIPIETRRGNIKLNKEQIYKKTLRFSTVALNASKQSKRASIPIIHPVTKFDTALELLSQRATLFIPSLETPRENILLTFQKIPVTHAVALFIGPEGDFTPEEYSNARKKGCIPVSLGDTILKVETAAICAVACAKQFFFQQ